MDNKITVEFCTPEKPLFFCTENFYVVEKLTIESCKYLNIGPLARHLFGLWSQADGLWLPPSMKLYLTNGKNWTLSLKVRFRTPNIKRLIVSISFLYYSTQPIQSCNIEFCYNFLLFSNKVKKLLFFPIIYVYSCISIKMNSFRNCAK